MKTPQVIDLQLDEPSRMSPALSQIDRLLKQSLLETQSLHVVRHLLMREQADKAQSNGVSKLLAAASMRQEHVNGVAPKKRRSKMLAGRKSPAERKAEIVTYLREHSGEDTQQIAAGLGWRPALVIRFISDVAKGKFNGHRKPQQWFLKQPPSPSPGRATKPTPKAPHRPQGTLKEQIADFLRLNPEAYTRDVAKALRRKPNSSLVKVMRTVAKPLRETKATQPIQWVLSA